MHHFALTLIFRNVSLVTSLLSSDNFKQSKKFEYRAWKFNSILARFITRYCAIHGQYSSVTISRISSHFCCRFNWLRLLKMKAVLSCRASGGAVIFSSLSVATSRVSMLVALAMEGYENNYFMLNSRNHKVFRKVERFEVLSNLLWPRETWLESLTV